MIIDINAFIGMWPHWPIRSTGPTDVVSELAGYKIDRAAICSTRSVFVQCEDGNVEVEAAAHAQPESLIPFACLGTRELSHALPSSDWDLESYERRGFAGLRLYPQHHSYDPLHAPFLDRILEDAAARTWPVMLPLRIIMNWGMPSLDLHTIESLVERHPKVTWILAGINYLHELQLAIALMRRHPSVHLETSCVMGYAAISKLVESCGSDQLLLGTGAPIQHGGAGVAKILHANISDAAREALLGGNATRILGGD